MYAIIEGGVVINVIMWDGKSSWEPPEGSTVVEIPDGTIVGVGYAYNGTTFTAPAVQP